jgi:hypothetical protein
MPACVDDEHLLHVETSYPAFKAGLLLCVHEQLARRRDDAVGSDDPVREASWLVSPRGELGLGRRAPRNAGSGRPQNGAVSFSVPGAEQAELLGILGPLRSDIVEVESPATGTPLPEEYNTAPPLAAV